MSEQETFEVWQFGNETSDLPEWARLILYNSETGEIFWSQLSLPLDVLAPVADQARGRALVDEKGHYYIESTWAIELSKTPGLLRQLEAKVRQAIEEDKRISATISGWPIQ